MSVRQHTGSSIETFQHGNSIGPNGEEAAFTHLMQFNIPGFSVNSGSFRPSSPTFCAEESSGSRSCSNSSGGSRWRAHGRTESIASPHVVKHFVTFSSFILHLISSSMAMATSSLPPSPSACLFARTSTSCASLGRCHQHLNRKSVVGQHFQLMFSTFLIFATQIQLYT